MAKPNRLGCELEAWLVFEDVAGQVFQLIGVGYSDVRQA